MVQLMWNMGGVLKGGSGGIDGEAGIRIRGKGWKAQMNPFGNGRFHSYHIM